MDQKSTTKTNSAPTEEALLLELGRRLAQERLRRNLTQEALAEEAGVSRATIRRLESGQSTQLGNLIRILRALRLEGNLDVLVPEPTLRPLESLERAGKERQRASSPREEERTDTEGWRWGEDR